MTQHSVLYGIFSAVLTLFAAGQTQAVEPPLTTISVEGMHCAGCASKVAGNLQKVAGVSSAQVDAAKAVAIVTANPNGGPSPRALWEAVEVAGYKPTKLVGPSGTFRAKPKS